MTWNYAFNTRMWPSLLAILPLLVLFIYTWPRRTMPGARVFAIGILFALFWAAGSSMENAAVNAAEKVFWVKFQALWQLPATAAITCFILEYIWPGRWLTRRNLVLFSIAPLLSILFIITNDLHHRFWVGFSVNGTVVPQLGPVAWLFIFCAYILGIVNLVALAWLFVHSPQHRWSVVIVATGQIGIRIIYMLEKMSVLHSDLALDIVGLAFNDLMYAIALYGFRMFDPVPLARQAVIRQMQIGMVVLDAQGRVVFLNPCAEQMLAAPARQVKGKPIHDVFPAYPDGTGAGPGRIEIELNLPGARHYTLSVSPLADFRGWEMGRLLLLQDITEQKRAHAQIINQQRSLATLQERERLGRELHDDLAQDLALINVQAQLVSDMLEMGQAEQARAQLQLLAKEAREAQVDVRGEISKLSQSHNSEEDFLVTLQHFTQTFQKSYGITTRLLLPEDHPAQFFELSTRVQLLRIVQEAFANIRKHSRATNVDVTVAREAGCVMLTIQDNGIGFDPSSSPEGAAHPTYGLGVMSSRAKEFNGRVEVTSRPGEGARITVLVPVTGP